MCFIKSTATDVRIIGANDLLNMMVMIDSAHAVHKKMRGHTGGIATFGIGVINQKSSNGPMCVYVCWSIVISRSIASRGGT